MGEILRQQREKPVEEGELILPRKITANKTSVMIICTIGEKPGITIKQIAEDLNKKVINIEKGIEEISIHGEFIEAHSTEDLPLLDIRGGDNKEYFFLANFPKEKETPEQTRRRMASEVKKRNEEKKKNLKLII